MASPAGIWMKRKPSSRGPIGPAPFRALRAETWSDALMTFVMPRLRNPHVLQAERHRALLEQLQSDLAGSADDRIVREGVLTIRRELKRLSQLRQSSNSLVEG